MCQLAGWCCLLRFALFATDHAQVCAFAQHVPAAANGHEGEEEDLNQQAAALLAKSQGMLVPKNVALPCCSGWCCRCAQQHCGCLFGSTQLLMPIGERLATSVGLAVVSPFYRPHRSECVGWFD
jgi:hypothetical protein